MYCVPWPLPALMPTHYRMRSLSARTWKPADDLVISAHQWLDGWVLSLDWIAAQRITDSQLIAGTEWQVETAQGVNEYRSVRYECLPMAKIMTVRLRAA
jgi:hypothetical protein